MRLVSDAEDSFATHTFPSTTEELIEEYGEMELELPNGQNTLADVLSRLPETEYESSEEALEAAYGVLGEEAIGRKGYSDRDPLAPGERDSEPLSL
ncbi:DUF5789 family protein [Halovenus sp. HT40]|uniref:DUF5789 family protein n=1 Tax=Halovenus sp. HT40 TaxID=3126691 RepID=UPI00300F7A5B